MAMDDKDRPLTLDDLPPLPEPDHATLRVEQRRGVAVVFGVISLCIGVTHGVLIPCGGSLGPAAWWACTALVQAAALLALCCFAVLYYGDPGVVRRSESACFPLPPAVEARLRAGENASALNNIIEGRDTFCVRCLVWRRADDGPPHHHCRTCNRCVRQFDHHCGVFGRCIAGGRSSGNKPAFVCIILMGYVGVLTTLASVLAALTTAYSLGTAAAAVGGAIAGAWLVSCVVVVAARAWRLAAGRAASRLQRQQHRRRALRGQGIADALEMGWTAHAASGQREPLSPGAAGPGEASPCPRRPSRGLVSGVPSERAEHAECETRSPSQARPAAGKGDSSSLGAYASVPVPELGGRGHVLNGLGALSGGAAAACGDCERDRDDML